MLGIEDIKIAHSFISIMVEKDSVESIVAELVEDSEVLRESEVADTCAYNNKIGYVKGRADVLRELNLVDTDSFYHISVNLEECNSKLKMPSEAATSSRA